MEEKEGKDIPFLDAAFDLLHSDDSRISDILPSDWAEKRRVMTSDVSSFVGPFSYDRTPYLVEPINCLAPSHPARKVAVMKGAQVGFALDVDTPIITPEGFRPMAEIKQGDYVYNEKGMPTKVTKATAFMNDHRCYAVTFTDGSVINCDAQHLWTVFDLKGKKRVMSTEEILNSGYKRFATAKSRERNRYYIPNSFPIHFEEKELPIEPYLLGLWLGDGHTNSNRISGETNDLFFYQNELFNSGIECSIHVKGGENNGYMRIKDAFNTWKGGKNFYGDKHIPYEYITASYKQRLSLIQGLIDTDGHVMKDGKVEFYNTNHDLIRSVKVLIESIGYKVTMRCRSNDGKFTKIHPTRRYKMRPLYVLNFMGCHERPVARLRRKECRLRRVSEIRPEIFKRWICDIKHIESRPVKCISVESENNLFLAGTSFIPTHNSTGVIENGIGWIISEQPGPIYLLTGAQILSKVSVETKIDQMIQSCGLRDLIRPNVIKKRNQRTGDTSKVKEFAGGILLTGETGNHKNIRQVSMRYGFIDDYEAAPPSTKQSGDTMALIEQRFASYATKMKIFYISTPEVKQTSNIEPAFLMGDQRYFHVPCPCCGSYIVLQWKTQTATKKAAGIVWKTDDRGRLIEGSVGYVCQECGDFFTDANKYEMNMSGKWVATAEPSEPGFYSYHISALYAPLGMYDWEHYVREYMKARPEGAAVNVPKEKAFYNLCLGLPHHEKGESPSISRLAQNTRTYEVGTVPVLLSEADGNGDIVLVTCAIDLNGTEEDARIDYEIVAWSETGSNYSVDHGSCGTFIQRENTLKKKVDRKRYSYEYYAKNSVWPLVLEVLQQTFPTDRNDGSEMRVMITGVDCGYHSQYAYNFLDKAEQSGLWCIGLRGKNTERFRAAGIDTKLYTTAKERDNLMLVEVNTIKDEMVPRMKMRWDEREGVAQPVEFINFPRPKDGKYTAKSFFSHWESEHKVFKKNEHGQITGQMWEKKNSAVMNHHWDTRIYNEAMREIFSDMACHEMGIKNPSWKAYCNAVTGKD